VYKAYFGLARNPFEITPDPAFFYGTPRHNEALASLCHGIDRRKGFIVVTGEVGTGKTLLARCLFRTLKWHKISFAYVFNPRLSVLEFLQYSMNDMGLPLSGKSKGELLSELNRYLISQYAQRSTVVLVIDEAHLLSWELLEEIRLLTNLETEQQKLLQIVLFGQPELDEKLDCAELRQLKQRIGLRCRLMPLTRDDTQKYIALRLWLAGATDRHQTLFSEPAVELIHQYSGGIPRLVNTICEAALIASFAVKSPTVLPQIIDEIAEEFCLYNPSPSEKKRAGRAEPNVAAQGAAMDIALEAL
jgi:type II secretory pathway predicted ATPase ExeA